MVVSFDSRLFSTTSDRCSTWTNFLKNLIWAVSFICDQSSFGEQIRNLCPSDFFKQGRFSSNNKLLNVIFIYIHNISTWVPIYAAYGSIRRSHGTRILPTILNTREYITFSSEMAGAHFFLFAATVARLPCPFLGGAFPSRLLSSSFSTRSMLRASRATGCLSMFIRSG